MFNDKISIITASYNYAQYISECIESVIAQTYQNWELIIVDDGSTDNSVEIIQSYCKKDHRIKLYQHKNGQNKGLKDTILLGLKQANSEWVAFLESDDKFLPNYLEEKIKIIEQEPDVKFIFNDFEIIDNTSFYFTSWYYKFSSYVLPCKGFLSLKKEMCEINCIPTFSVVMAKKKLLETLDFNTPIDSHLDYYLWLQLTPKIKFYFLNKKLTQWRKHSGSYITKTTFSGYKFYFNVGKYFPQIFINKIFLTIKTLINFYK